MKKFISALSLLFVLLMVISIPVGAAQAYQTYTYSIDGDALHSPDAYEAHVTLSTEKMGLGETALNGAKDIVTDQAGNVYIADTGNSRILVFDRYYNLKQVITEFRNDQEVVDHFNKPQGLFVTEDRYVEGVLKPGKIYVCDTQASRIITFKQEEGKWVFDAILPAPESNLFEEGAIYWPVAIAVDMYDRLFVVSAETHQGIIVMTSKGEFTGLVGAQQSVISVWDQIWSRFQTEEQREASVSVVSYPYNNITVNEDGLIYATIWDEALEPQMQSAISGKSTAGTYAPCKLLNPSGAEIMRRNGFWPPAGEIDLGNPNVMGVGVSKVEDVACGPEQTWTIVDTKRNKLYTYDYDGNLLFAFGDSGTQLGNMNNIQSIVYQGDKLVVLSGGTSQTITVFKRTEYGDVLIQALHHQNERQYDLAVEDWKEILMRNSNYDAAYVGIGQALFRTGNYEEALHYYKTAYDLANYSEAYKELRTEWMSRFFILIPIVVVVLCILIVKGLSKAGKINARVAVSGKKPTFKEELCYVFHVMFHPFDGFYDLKHEKRGSVRAAIFFLLLAVASLFYRSVGSGYVMNPRGQYSTVFMQFLVVFIPVLLFAIANWCLTTLFDGEGSFKDIFVAIGYSVLPIPLTIIPTTIFSNFVVSSETNLLTLFTTLGFIWAGFLIFFGMMVTHDYTMSKGFVTTLGTIVGMVFIMFIGILFTSLVMDIMTFVTDITSEINYRL